MEEVEGKGEGKGEGKEKGEGELYHFDSSTRTFGSDNLGASCI